MNEITEAAKRQLDDSNPGSLDCESRGLSRLVDRGVSVSRSHVSFYL